MPGDSSARPTLTPLAARGPVPPRVARLVAACLDDPRLAPVPDTDLLLARAASQATSAAEIERLALAAVLEAVWPRYEPLFRALTARRVWRADDVDDVLQDAAARALARLSEFAASELSLFGWLCVLVRQQSVDWVRHSLAEMRDVNRAVPLTADGPAAELSAALTSPTEYERRGRLRSMVHTALDDLPPTDREVLVLSLHQALTPHEIAAVLGIEPGTARKRLFDARRRFMTAWIARFPGTVPELREARP